MCVYYKLDDLLERAIIREHQMSRGVIDAKTYSRTVGQYISGRISLGPLELGTMALMAAIRRRKSISPLAKQEIAFNDRQSLREAIS